VMSNSSNTAESIKQTAAVRMVVRPFALVSISFYRPNAAC
jgi:hypothetical protein